MHTYQLAAVKDISPSPFNPRRHKDPVTTFGRDKMEELTASIRASGLHNPLLVRPHPTAAGADPPPTAYELVLGERRFRAAQLAGLREVPVLIRQMTDEQVREAQLVENLQREDLDPIEEAEGYRDLLALKDGEKPRYTQAGLAKALGKSQPAIANRLSLLKLPDTVQEQVAASASIRSEEARPLSPSHARALVPFSRYPWILEAIQKRIREEGLPPAKEFPDMISHVLWGQFTKVTMLVRPMSKTGYQAGGTREFETTTKGLSRDWSQIGEDPGPGPCTDCPHLTDLAPQRTWQAEKGQRDLVCCLSLCWEGKQQAARKQARARQDPEGKQAAKLQAARADVQTISEQRVQQEYKGTWEKPGHHFLQRGPGFQHDPTLFDLGQCRKACPHKLADGGTAYRRVYRSEKGKYSAAGEVCLLPEHFRQLQREAAIKLRTAWVDGTVARLKGVAAQARKVGLTSEDLARLVLANLDRDIFNRKLQAVTGRELGNQFDRLAMTELFVQAFGLQEKALQLKVLAGKPRKELEVFLRFALQAAGALRKDLDD